MIDLAALTQARDRASVAAFAGMLDVYDKALLDAARLVSRLWQPCQNCDGTGTKWTHESGIEPMGPLNVNVGSSSTFQTCPSCGGVGVESTLEAREIVFDVLAKSPVGRCPYEFVKPVMPIIDSILMALWRVANEDSHVDG